MFLKNLFRSIFPRAPGSLPSAIHTTLEMQRTMIYALVAHIEADGSKVVVVRVPEFTGIGSGTSFTASATGSQINVVPGLDPYGANVVVAPPIRTALMRTALDELAVTTNPRTANTATPSPELVAALDVLKAHFPPINVGLGFKDLAMNPYSYAASAAHLANTASASADATTVTPKAD